MAHGSQRRFKVQEIGSSEDYRFPVSHLLVFFSSTLIIGLLSCALASVVHSQTRTIFEMSPDERATYLAKINSESFKDWQRTINLLNIELPDSLPPPLEDPNRPRFTFQKTGSSNWYDSAGNLYTRSAWGKWNNYDETKANPFPDLPDPLKLSAKGGSAFGGKDGRPVKSAETWWNERRRQIVADFDNEIYGKVPNIVPAVRWTIVSTKDTMVGKTPVTMKEIVGHVDNSADTRIVVNIQLTLTTPTKAKHSVPVIMEFGFVFPPGFSARGGSAFGGRFPGMPEQKGPSWQEQVLDKGWGYAIYVPTSVQPDNGAGLTEGIIGLVNKGQLRSPDQWGALRAWAWGASRTLDYFETDKSVDAKKIGIEGLSRYGKAVLVTMAYDQRFAVALVGSSGKGGAALYRRDFGEAVGNLCSSGGYHWFAGNFLKYVLKPDDLSVDSHELIALCAPRPVFISCGSPEKEGNWVDDKGQFMAVVAAAPVFELLGERGLSEGPLRGGASTAPEAAASGGPLAEMPPIGTSLLGSTLAFRQHHEGHAVGPNWPYFLEFAQRYLGAWPSNVSK